MGEIRFMDAKRQLGLQFIGQHPGEFLWLSAGRCFRYWTAPDELVWLPLSLMAWLGAAVALSRKGRGGVPYVVILLVFPLVYYITHTFNSYRHPTEPAMLLLAAYAMMTAVEALGSSRVSRKLRRRLVRLEPPHLTILVIQQ
jgi:hypothetical protein